VVLGCGSGGRVRNCIESSASAIFVYALLKKVRTGVLEEEERYVSVTRRAY